MKWKRIQTTTAVICFCALLGGLYLIRASSNVASEAPRSVSPLLREVRPFGALDLDVKASQGEGYIAQLPTDTPDRAKADPVEEDKKEDRGQDWSNEECKRFTAHLQRLESMANGGESFGDPESRAAAKSWCADRDLSPAFMRCALSKDSSATLLECGEQGPRDNLDIPTLSDEDVEAALTRFRAHIE